ncbi:hypothetical protein ACHAXT_008334 [Thalassiosira profunda]
MREIFSSEPRGAFELESPLPANPLRFAHDMACHVGVGPPSRQSRSARGIYRRKHALRAIFRSASLLLLIGGYALYNRYGGGGEAAVQPGQGFRGGEDAAARLQTIPDDGGLDVEKISRRLQGEEGTETATATTDGDGEEGVTTKAIVETQPNGEGCPILQVAEPAWLAAFYAVGVLYMFLALAIVCDEFFVPALEEISSEHHLNLSMDVAGATLMAAGGSAPELFTSFVGTFQESDIGIGTIVGSAVFNVLFVIGTCALLSKEVLTLTWWPLFRDCSYYAVGLVVLSVLAGVVSEGKVYWWEALILLLMYVGYVTLMYFNRKLYKRLTGKELILAGEESEETADESEETAAETTTNGAAAEEGAAEEAAENGNGSSTPLEENGEDVSPASSDTFLTAPNASLSPAVAKINRDFRWPGTFRAGVLKLLLHPESLEERAGVGIVAKIQGDVDHVFRQIDINGDGTIDKEELGKLFQKLGHDIGEEQLEEVFTQLDLDGNGEICEEEFSKWYVKSEERILSKVRPVFDRFDVDKSGTIERDEVRDLLKTLEPRVTESDVDDAMAAMFKSGNREEITYEEFADWYVHSIIYSRQQSLIERKIEEEAQGACEALKPPRGEGCWAWTKYLIVLPLVAALTLTIPDVRRPGFGKWCYLSFVLSIVWIGFFSFFMVWWAEILGNTIGVPSVVMGYTVLAAGTSVPDLLSSVIVARMGEGDMAVSSSIGSNIFDILVGLPLPWLIYTLWPTTKDVVTIQAKGIWQSIFILIGMLVAIIAIVHCQGWKMTRTLGGLMFVLYFVFLVQAIVTEYYQNPCFG